jgi:glycosyltransferase involved in cell wall biosynthesis
MTVALHSITKIPRDTHEVILVDDRSVDRTVEVDRKLDNDDVGK